MKWFKDLKIKTKLLAGFSFLIALNLIVCAAGIAGLFSLHNISVRMYEHEFVAVKALGDMREAFQQERIYFRDMLIYIDDPVKVNEAIENVDASHLQGDAGVNLYLGTIEDFALEGIFLAMGEILNPPDGAYYKAKEKIIEAARAGDAAGVLENIEATGAYIDAIEQSLITMAENRSSGAEAGYASDKAFFQTFVIFQVSMLVVIILFSVITALVLSLGVEKDLRQIIGKLKRTTEHILGSADQLNEASDHLAAGSARQAAAIEETSATMNETASMVQQNAENTRVAAQLALESQQAVEESGKHMSNLMNTMSELKESSDKVSKIVKTIDDIAFQTNLLAINATVEAARAGGDAGRSFAVVAQEVRDLAQKSAGASSETAEIIERNISLTDTSRTSAGRALEITEKDSEQIVKLNKLISEINAASEEQASGIKQINMAISQMEKVTQENAAVAEENAASSNSMKDEIGNLEEAISIAKGLIRDSASGGGSLLGSVRRPGGGAKNSYAPRTSSYTSPSPRQEPRKTIPAPTAYKPQGSANQARTQSGNASADAEKIIPLGDDDDF